MSSVLISEPVSSGGHTQPAYPPCNAESAGPGGSAGPQAVHDDGKPAASSDGGRSLPVAVAILAAGLSRRMGVLNKLVQDIDGAPMVRRVAQQALASRGDRVFVVVGHEADKVREALSGLPLGFVDNPNYREGLAASVRAAAQAARRGEALMICLGDMPQVSTAVMDRLIEAYHGRAAGDHASAGGGTGGDHGSPDKAAYQPEFEGRRGNPVLWTPRAISLLTALRGDEGARAVLKSLGDAVMAVPVRSGGIFMDIDTPQALQAARQGEKFLRT